MKEKYLDQKKVRGISDIDLSDPFHVRHCFQQWDALMTLGEQHLKVKDLFMELEQRWKEANLSEQQRRAMVLYLVEGYTQREAGEMLGMGTRAVAKMVDDGLNVMALCGDKYDG